MTDTTPNFDWIPFYIIFANRLLKYKNNRKELLIIFNNIFKELKLKNPLIENNTELNDISPFTIFAIFNRGISESTKLELLQKIKSNFSVEPHIPTSFDGIPSQSRQLTRFEHGSNGANVVDIDLLWDIFESGIAYADNPSKKNKNTFVNFYNLYGEQSDNVAKLTKGLYWIRPYNFLTMEKCVTDYFYDIGFNYYSYNDCNKYISNLEKYHEYCRLKDTKVNTFPELIYHVCERDLEKDIKLCWYIDEKILQDLYDEDYNSDGDKIHIITNSDSEKNIVNSIKIGDKIAVVTKNIKKTPVMTIKGLYNVISNPKNSKTIYALKRLSYNWDGRWYYFINKSDIWKVESDSDDWREKALLDFTFNDTPQDVDKFSKNSDGNKFVNIPLVVNDKSELYMTIPYSESDFLTDVFISKEKYQAVKTLLLRKQNIILSGPPGVGKTFSAKRLAYSIIGYKDKKFIRTIQFHQNYSYEDFIQGFRPTDEGFKLINGPFYDFCKKAESDPENKYFFIIDEINRGNLSKIFGELLMLIESDKRGDKIKILYSDTLFSVPKNLYIIGMMNTADRSLAMIDYALRRRFSFIELEPAFDSEGFEKQRQEINNPKYDELINAVKFVNSEILKDSSLGDGCLIGHSYLCPNCEVTNEWIESVIEYELIPLIREYWFDNKTDFDVCSKKLRNVLSDK